MYADHTMLQIAGQVVMGGFFIFQGVKNVSKWQFNMDRTTALGLPLPPALVLIAGFTIQFAGAAIHKFSAIRSAANGQIIGIAGAPSF